jgi:hypothetical protein
VKGIVFNLLEEVVSAEHGEDVWDALLDSAGVSGVYTSLGGYPDEELDRLVLAASSALGVPADDVVRWFGLRMMPLFAQRYPALFADYTSWRPFVLGVNEVIHPEVGKLYPGAITPTFVFDASSSHSLAMHYRSPRQLCALAEGLLAGAAAHYGEAIGIDQPLCIKRGDDRCIIVASPA